MVQQVFWSSMHLCAPLVLLPVQLMLPHARSVVGRPWCWGQVAVPQNKAHLDVPDGSGLDQMVNGSIGYYFTYLYIMGIYWGYTLVLVDPNFLGHPSRWWFQSFFQFSPGTLGKWSNLTYLSMGWFNHQLEQLKCHLMGLKPIWFSGKRQIYRRRWNNKSTSFCFGPVWNGKNSFLRTAMLIFPGCDWMNLASSKFWIPKKPMAFSN